MHRAALGLRADELGVAGAVGLAEGVAAGDEGDGLLVGHAHAAEGHADVVAEATGSGWPLGPSGLT